MERHAQFDRLSLSPLWEVMRRFYAVQGLKSWSQEVVPSYITCNMRSAHTVVSLLWGIVQQLEQEGEELPPVYMVEFGAGAGNLSFWVWLLVKEHPVLGPMLLHSRKLRIVVSDCAESIIEGWMAMPVWQRATECDQGVDFACVDLSAWDGSSFTTRCHGWAVGEPAFIVGLFAYVFDTLPHDAFCSFGDGIQESCVALRDDRCALPAEADSRPSSPATTEHTAFEHHVTGPSESAPTDESDEWTISDRVSSSVKQVPSGADGVDAAAVTVSRLDLLSLSPEEVMRMKHLVWSHQPLEEPYYQPDEGTNRLLNGLIGYYRVYFNGLLGESSDSDSEDDRASGAEGPSSARFALPTGGLAALDHLRLLSGGNAAAIVLDKGFSDPKSFLGLGVPELAIHGSFSLMVNFHACELFTTSRGGWWWVSGSEGDDLRVGVSLLKAVAHPPSRLHSACLSACGTLDLHSFFHVVNILPVSWSVQANAAPHHMLLCRTSPSSGSSLAPSRWRVSSASVAWRIGTPTSLPVFALSSSSYSQTRVMTKS
jgi:hypothetical protein